MFKIVLTYIYFVIQKYNLIFIVAAPAPAGCAEAEDVTECCDKLNELEQDEDGDDVSKDACTQCILDSACKFYRNIGGSIAEIQTKCLVRREWGRGKAND